MIDESFAREYFPNEDPIGKRINIGIINTEPEIVGVVGHVKHWGLDTDGDAKHPIVAQAYMPLMQIPDQFWNGPPQAEVVVRTKGSPAGMVPAIRDAIEKMNSENVMYETKPLEQVVAESLADAAILDDSAWCICGPRAAAIEHRDLRRDFICGGPAHS